jgi:hypothetical protein
MDKRQIAAVDIFSSVLLLGKLHVVNGLYWAAPLSMKNQRCFVRKWSILHVSESCNTFLKLRASH